MPITKEIYAKLYELKEDCGLTFKQIGEIVNSSEANVRRYVLGEVKTPDRQLLHAIIRAMDGDPDEIIGKKKAEAAAAAPAPTYSVNDQLYDRMLDSIKAAYEKSLESKDSWIEKIKKDWLDAEDEVRELKTEKRRLQIAIVVLSVVVLLFILVYLVPDVFNGDWGHIIYSKVQP